jgi:hypothetical protein
MGVKLNQIIAIANGKKAAATAAITEIYKVLQKPDLFGGFTRVYQPNDDEGEKLPSESKIVQQTVAANLRAAQEQLVELFDTIATQEVANCEAKADIVVGGTTLATQVPVSLMLFLEKQVDNMKALISKLPVLSTDTNWKVSESDPNIHVTDTVTTTRTKKVPKAFVKAAATDKHPAQVDVFTEDIIVGNWNKVEMSSAVRISTRDAMLKKVDSLREAIKMAREEANSIEVKKIEIGKKITDFVFGG